MFLAFVDRAFGVLDDDLHAGASREPDADFWGAVERVVLVGEVGGIGLDGEAFDAADGE